jgi:hypothetical protein
LVNALHVLVAMVMPGEGPSLGMAPSGHMQVDIEVAVEVTRQTERVRPGSAQ